MSTSPKVKAARSKRLYDQIWGPKKKKPKEIKMDPQHVAIYDNLKSGFCQNRILGKSESFGTGLTYPAFAMVGRSAPMVFRSSHGYPILVEVFEVNQNTLALLDKYYGFGWLNSREIMSITFAGDVAMPCWMYIGKEKYSEGVEFEVPNEGHYAWEGKPLGVFSSGNSIEDLPPTP